MERIKAGQRLPKIVLPDQDRNPVDLSEFKGKKLLLSFHPLAWTDVCMRQMEALEMNADVFEAANAVAFGISVDPAPSKKAWADALHIEKTRLLSDFWPHGAASGSLGLFREKEGTSERAAVIVDEEGIVRYVEVYPLGEVPNVDVLIEKLQEI